MAHALLRPFFEAHQIVADVLCASASDVDDETLTRRALGVGRQYAAQNLIRGTESASTPLFATTRQVANDQGLLQDGDDLQGRRAAHLAEITGILGDLDRIEQCWLAQR
jgi:glycerol-3-phosphate O-acyltransferase